MIIKCDQITATYRPKIKERLYNLVSFKKPHRLHQPYALNNFSHTFSRGATILLGPNSGGKSTLLCVLAGILQPAGGTIQINGQTKSPAEFKHLISYLPQIINLYPEFSAYEMLDYIAILKGISGKDLRRAKIEQVLSETGLLPVKRQRLKTYSRGMLQRIGIAQTLLSDTPILLLDEPTASLDPAERNNVLNLLLRLSQNYLVLFSSSNLQDIAAADNALILHEGHCCFAGSPADLAAYKPAVLAQIGCHTFFSADTQKGYQAVLAQVNEK